MTRLKITFLWGLLFVAFSPGRAYGDFWGGDIPLLTEIVANTLQQLEQMRQILGTGQDTLGLLRDINKGVRDALNLTRTMNNSLTPGVLSDLTRVEDLLSTVEKLYGQVPQTSEATMQRTTDQSVAEAIHLHNEAFRYADLIDPEAERIKEYSRDVSPLGAERLTAQSLGVMIHVLNQVLRTNASILKIQSEQLALQNRKEKLSSQQFKMQYEGLSKAFGDLKGTYKLPELSK